MRKKTMKMIITALGSGGDVFPFLALGAILRQRGHTVTLIANPHFATEVAQAGLELTPLGTEAEYRAFIQQPEVWEGQRGFPIIWRQLMDLTPRLLATIEAEIVPGQTVLVGSTLSLATRLAQERRPVPAATVHLAPNCFLSAYDFPVGSARSLPAWTPLWARKALLTGIDRGLLDATCAKPLNRLRASLGLPPVRSVMRRWLHSPDLTIGAFPDWLAAPQPDWPASAVVTGFLRWRDPAAAALPEEIQTFLEAGPPPLVFTAGTGMIQARGFFACARQTVTALGLRALFITRFAETLPDPLPSCIQTATHLPFDHLLPRVAALVHHGGIGTLAASLAAGVPQLIVPFAFDQFDNARRAERLGVARSCPRIDFEAWTTALRDLLTPDDDRRDALARYRARMEAAPDPAIQIAERLEKLAARAGPD
jgi:rhamnosyltransferase subunit B